MKTIMHKATILHKLRSSLLARHFLSGFVLALLIVQWGVIQHLESHLSGGNTDVCQICTLGNHMSGAMSVSPPAISGVPSQTDTHITKPQKPASAPHTIFLARAPPLSKV